MCAAAATARAVDPSGLCDSERLAFWVNVYNAPVIQASVEFGLRARVDELGGQDAFFARAAYEVAGETFSPDDIEHGILRANRGYGTWRGAQFAADDPRAPLCLPAIDPRLHFVLHCGDASCPAVGVLDIAAWSSSSTTTRGDSWKGRTGSPSTPPRAESPCRRLCSGPRATLVGRPECCCSWAATWISRTSRTVGWAIATTTGGWARCRSAAAPSRSRCAS